MSLLAINGLRVQRGARAILNGVDLTINAGEVCAVLGESGAGKSTLLRAIAALEPFTAGNITVGDFSLAPGAVPAQSRLRALRSQVGMVFQVHALFEHITARENVTLALAHVGG